MESLITCEVCSHGAIVHEATGCSIARCACRKTMSALVEETVEAAKGDIRRDWHLTT
ncbi:MAG: hypothetical protein NVS2B3_15310 [Vulcanimicrobiaceae bacterium]